MSSKATGFFANIYTVHVARKKNRAAVLLGKLRSARLSPERRKEIARKGGLARADQLPDEEIARIARNAGRVGGKARAEKLSAEERSAIARKAVAARWANKKQNGT